MSLNSLSAFFNPKGIAVIGVSKDPNKPSSAIFTRLVEKRKRGLLKAAVYPVNPNYTNINGIRVYPSVSSIEDRVDLAIIAVPAEFTPRIVKDCGKKGIRAIVIISGGFSEIGRFDLEEKILVTAKEYNMRIIGPNTIGLLDTYTGVDTLFLPKTRRISSGKIIENLPEPRPGNVTILSQSGFIGESIMDLLTKSGIGVRALICLGNQIDVSMEEMLEYFAEDEKTKIVIMYVESIKDERRFVKSAYKITSKKPVIALKGGRTLEGARAVLYHTGREAGNLKFIKEVFRQAGIIEVESFEELVDVGKIFSMQPLTNGNKLLVITNAGGAAVIASDTAPQHGLEIPPLSKEDKAKLDELKKSKIILPIVAYNNPLDLTGSATNEAMVKAYETLAQNYDMCLFIPTHQPPTLDERVIDKLAEVAKKIGKPVVGCDLGDSECSVYFRRKLDELKIPSYPTIERAVKSLAFLAKYRKVLQQIKKAIR